jgi:WhiB family redox-sensing transcriptional regulator
MVEEERNLKAYRYINAVRSICGRCPIFQECLTYGFGNEQYGVWGGLTTAERKAVVEPKKYPAQLRRALFDLDEYGITYDQIMEAYEHSLNE